MNSFDSVDVKASAVRRSSNNKNVNKIISLTVITGTTAAIPITLDVFNRIFNINFKISDKFYYFNFIKYL